MGSSLSPSLLKIDDNTKIRKKHAHPYYDSISDKKCSHTLSINVDPTYSSSSLCFSAAFSESSYSSVYSANISQPKVQSTIKRCNRQKLSPPPDSSLINQRSRPQHSTIPLSISQPSQPNYRCSTAVWLCVLLLLLRTVRVSTESSICPQKEIECIECDSNEHKGCADPMNATSVKSLPREKCQGYCVKWVLQTEPNGPPIQYRRTCSKKMKIHIQINLVCIKESRSGYGQMCFCRKDLCNSAPSTFSDYLPYHQEHHYFNKRVLSVLLSLPFTGGGTSVAQSLLTLSRMSYVIFARVFPFVVGSALLQSFI